MYFATAIALERDVGQHGEVVDRDEGREEQKVVSGAAAFGAERVAGPRVREYDDART